MQHLLLSCATAELLCWRRKSAEERLLPAYSFTYTVLALSLFVRNNNEAVLSLRLLLLYLLSHLLRSAGSLWLTVSRTCQFEVKRHTPRGHCWSKLLQRTSLTSKHQTWKKSSKMSSRFSNLWNDTINCWVTDVSDKNPTMFPHLETKMNFLCC